MKKNALSLFLLAVSFWLLSTPLAEARVGGGRSSGSRGSRGSYGSSPYRSSQGSGSSSSPYRSAPTYPSAPQQPAGGGFMRSLGAGLLGGAIGSMLFGGMRGGYGGGGGIGLLEILLLAGLAFLVIRFLRSRQPASEGGPQYGQNPFSIPPSYPAAVPQQDTAANPVDVLVAADPQFDLTQFNADRLDDFFRLQAAWANRDLVPLQPKLTDEMFGILNGHLQELKQRGQSNKLDNIAVRNTEVVDAWQEPGRLFATVLLTANLVDYTVSDTTGEVVSGSKTEPVKFSEAWTFVRDTGFTASNKGWRLSAIEQME